MYDSILIPLDGSAYAEKALQHVVCHEPDVRRLTLVRVVPRIEQVYGVRQPDPLDSMEKTEDMLAREEYDAQYGEARRYLQDMLRTLEPNKLDIQVELAEGDAAEEVLRLAKQTSADLIVIASHGWSASASPPKTGVFGKVADAILKRAGTPVLVVHALWG